VINTAVQLELYLWDCLKRKVKQTTVKALKDLIYWQGKAALNDSALTALEGN
jgi:hypothetical protein